MSDYVVDEYIEGDYKVKHWKSGFSEAWYTGIVNCAPYTTLASVFRAYSFSLSIPSGIFNASPNKIYTARVGNGFGFPGNCGEQDTMSLQKYLVLGTGTDTAVNITLNTYLWGTWDVPE